MAKKYSRTALTPPPVQRTGAAMAPPTGTETLATTFLVAL